MYVCIYIYMSSKEVAFRHVNADMRMNATALTATVTYAAVASSKVRLKPLVLVQCRSTCTGRSPCPTMWRCWRFDLCVTKKIIKLPRMNACGGSTSISRRSPLGLVTSNDTYEGIIYHRGDALLRRSVCRNARHRSVRVQRTRFMVYYYAFAYTILIQPYVEGLWYRRSR